MVVRHDLIEVSSYISRLLSYSTEFSGYNQNWIHLKNREDFKLVYKFSESDKCKVECLYGDGRDMALGMADLLSMINYDFSAFPTLTSIVDGLSGDWLNRRYEVGVPDLAIKICKTYGPVPWSVNQMYILFKRQEKMISAVRGTLAILKNSDLYKLENGLEFMNKNASTINISGNNSTSINVNSDNSSASVFVAYNEPTIFKDIVNAIRSSDIDEEVKDQLVDSTQTLALSHEKGSFSSAYKDFMQDVSAHITVFGPFLTGLAALL